MDPRDVTASSTLGFGRAGDDTAPPLLLLAPLGRDHLSWRAQLPVLAERYWCIAPDTRGTGASAELEGPYTLATFAADALALLDELQIGQAHVAGWSMGSAVAMELALTAPDRVRSLSLYTPWGRTDADLAARFRRMRDLAENGDDLVDVEEHTLELILSPEALAAIPDLRAAAAAATHEAGYPSREALIGHLDASIRHDALDRIPSLTCPTLVIAGEGDALTPAYLAREVAAAIPGAEYEEFTSPAASHALLLELAEPFNARARSFLDQH